MFWWVALGNCQSCGSETDPKDRFCIKCGATLNPSKNCRKCGAANPGEAEHCAECGQKLNGGKPSGTDSEILRIWSTQGEPDRRVEGNICPQCGVQALPTDWMCPNCGHDFYRLQTDSGELKDKSSMPVVVGVLLMIASILNIGNGLIVGSVGGAYVPAYGFCGMVEVLIGIVTIPGAIAAMNRQHFVPVGIVSVLTLFSVGPCFICSILGLIAIIGLFASHDEFDKG